jgi:cellulose synthase/poly-beta-1,6-N-acetylglucosamine synthase-like glycosyltransferase
MIHTIAIFFSGLYSKSLFLFAAVGMAMKLFSIQDTPYKIIGFFFTRKFKPAKKLHKYAVLIPGRNEEPVVGNLINSIKKQDYPQELITIFVVADNCTDQTAAVAREHGAICYEHFNPNERTKGFALKYLFEQIDRDYGVEAFDGYFIFDADNLLKNDYISRMNDAFDAGEKIITSYRSTKNFDESWIASVYALHWLRSIRFRHRARSFFHLATNIQGTGFLFSNEIVKDGWNYTSLTEDRALTADCVVNGYEISYNDAAIFYDEQPTKVKVALRQRLRWARGHLQAFVESGWGLFRNIFIDQYTTRKEDDKWYHYPWRTIRHRFMAFDTFCQLLPKGVVNIFRWIIRTLFLFPFTIYVSGGYLPILKNGTYLSKFVRMFTGDVLFHLQPGWKGYLTCVLLVLWMRIFYRMGQYVASIPIAIYLLLVERKRMMKVSLKKKIICCLTWPMYDLVENYVKLIALFKKVEWTQIPHNSKVTIDDIAENI